MTTQRRSREDETYAETFLDLKTTQTTFHQRPKNHSIATTTVTVTEIEESAEDTPTQSQTRALPALPSHIDLKATHLKSSPYDDPLNFLILTELATQERLFAIALTSLQSTRPNYATAPYLDSFNWSAVFALLRDLCTLSGVNWQQQEFYLVIFRSKLRSDADRNRLGQLDQKSHQEACESGGLLTYWFGTPDAEMRNLATCIWRNREDAAAGGKGPWHRKARGAAREMYENISFHTHRFVIGDGAETWSVAPYLD